MSNVTYTSNVRIERRRGPLRVAYLPGEAQPVFFSAHGAIAEHYKIDPAKVLSCHSCGAPQEVALDFVCRYCKSPMLKPQ